MPSAPRNCWTFTFRPKTGATSEHVEKVVKWIKKYDYAFLISEKADHECHLHGGIVNLDKEISSSVTYNFLTRIMPKDDGSIPTVCCKVKHWYNHDWYQNYCQGLDGTGERKLDQPTYIHVTIPKENWEALIPYAPPDDKKDVRPVNPWYDKVEKMILDDERFDEPWTEETILKALNTYMNKDRVLEVISDPKAMQQKTRALLRYMTHYDGDTYSNKKFKTEHQEDLDHTWCPKCDSVKEPFTRVIYKSPPTGH